MRKRPMCLACLGFMLVLVLDFFDVPETVSERDLQE